MKYYDNYPDDDNNTELAFDYDDTEYVFTEDNLADDDYIYDDVPAHTICAGDMTEDLYTAFINNDWLEQRLPGNTFGRWENDDIGNCDYILDPRAIVCYQGDEYSMADIIDSYGVDRI